MAAGAGGRAVSYAWGRLAAALAFTPRQTSAPFDLQASFRQLERDLRPAPVEPPIYTSHLLRGTWQGRRAFAIQHRGGAGDDRGDLTSVVVELAQPLHLATVFGPPRHFTLLDRLATPELGRWLSFQGADDATPRAFLRGPEPPDDLQRQLVDAIERGCSVTDSKVAWSGSGAVVDPDDVRAALDRCAALATALEARRAAAPRPPWDAELRQPWRDVAAARRLTFDEPRTQLTGELAGATLEVAIEERGPSLHTTVDVTFPATLGVDVELRKAAATPALTRWLRRGPQTGDRAFDAAFVVRGAPATHVRQLFAAPPLRAALGAVVGEVDDLHLHPHRVSWRRAAPLVERAALDRHLDAAAAIARAIFAIDRAAVGPYR